MTGQCVSNIEYITNMRNIIKHLFYDTVAVIEQTRVSNKEVVGIMKIQHNCTMYLLVSLPKTR